MEDPFRAAADDPGLRLIETAQWDGAACPRLEGHLARLTASAAALGWPCDAEAARVALTGEPGTPARLRLTLDRAGALEVTRAPLPPSPPEWRLGLATARLASADPYEAATALTDAEARLEKLYALTARLSRLSLMDYL